MVEIIDGALNFEFGNNDLWVSFAPFSLLPEVEVSKQVGWHRPGYIVQEDLDFKWFGFWIGLSRRYSRRKV